MKPQALKILERDDQLPIDLYALFEKILPYEMSHTKVGGASVDAKGGIFTGNNAG